MKKKRQQATLTINAKPKVKSTIAYQNKDIISKLFGEQMKGKPLSLFGLNTELKVRDIRPTNIPIVRAKELQMDNLFELEDRNIAILNYESDYKEANFLRYGYYIIHVIDRYLKERKEPDIHMIVLYTADIEKAKTTLERMACRIHVEVAYLAGSPSEQWLDEIQDSLDNSAVSDNILMHLILLPLTYKEEKKKQEAIKLCVNLAQQIPEKEQENFALAGILTFTDKIISKSMRKYIEVLNMTQVGKMLINRGRKEGWKQGQQETAKNMIKREDSPAEIAEILEFPIETIKAWEKKFSIN